MEWGFFDFWKAVCSPIWNIPVDKEYFFHLAAHIVVVRGVWVVPACCCTATKFTKGLLVLRDVSVSSTTIDLVVFSFQMNRTCLKNPTLNCGQVIEGVKGCYFCDPFGKRVWMRPVGGEGLPGQGNFPISGVYSAKIALTKRTLCHKGRTKITSFYSSIDQLSVESKILWRNHILI